MQLSKRSRAIFKDFFLGTLLCRENDFPNVRIYTGFGARMLTGFLLADGITFGRSIYVSPRWVKRTGDGRLIVSKHLLAHELVHVFQYQTEGPVRFVSKYAVDFLRGLKRSRGWNSRAWFEAYSSIPHEIEARKYASEFNQWLKDRNP